MVTDKKNATSNTFSRIVGEGNGEVSWISRLKLEDIRRQLWSLCIIKGISNFKNKDVDLEYFIALELDSKYNA